MGVLDGKTALVTGAGGGIGADYAKHLASLGASVLLADINELGAKTVAEEIAGAGGTAIGVAIDVTDEASIDTVVAAAAEQGGLDILVNNAAIYKGMTMAPVEQLTAKDFRQMFDVNVTGVFLVSKAFLPQLRVTKGVIVNQASAGAFTASKYASHYCASKSAVVSFTRSLAIDVGPDGIRVNCIAPGFTATEATLGNFPDPSRMADYEATAALRRSGTPADLCGALEFLTTGASAWMTGQTLVIDGGQVFPQ